MSHGNPLVRALVQRTMVRVCEPLFAMVKSWMFEGELVDQNELRVEICRFMSNATGAVLLS